MEDDMESDILGVGQSLVKSQPNLARLLENGKQNNNRLSLTLVKIREVLANLEGSRPVGETKPELHEQEFSGALGYIESMNEHARVAINELEELANRLADHI